MRNPKRTAATASALMIGVGLVTFITIFAASTKASFSATVDDAFTGDFVVTAGSGMAGVSTRAHRAGERAARDRRGGRRPRRVGRDRRRRPTSCSAPDPAKAFDVFDVDPVAGSPDDLDATSIAVAKDARRRQGPRDR